MGRKVIPLSLAGVWNADIKADREILGVLARQPYETVEDSVAEMLRVEQTPLWTVGKYRGVVSKIDAVFAVHPLITRQDIEDFFFTAHYILSEKDPALDLPEDKRWLASLYGKTRDHSPVLREGICETLVLLATHGNNLFHTRLGFDVQAQVNKLIRELLTPLDAATWASQQRDLPRYAEAAPEEFLDILEKDLKSDDPKILALLAPARGGLFGSCPRSGLLWALELLAWKPERMLRVAFILATFSKDKLDDNWANKPEGSLKSLFRSWMPQTSASVGERLTALETLATRFPEVGWQLCIDQFGDDFQTGHYSARPRWRNDAAGLGEPVTVGEMNQTRRKALDLAIDWPHHDEETLGDLVQRLHGIPHEDQEKIWDRIRDWASSTSDAEGRAALRETIRRYAFTRRGYKRNLAQNTRSNARVTYDLLEPSDEVIRHQWLFAKNWVEESQEELEDANLDINKREEKIALLRTEALKRIWDICGYEGVLRLCKSGDASHIVGWFLAYSVMPENLAEDFLYDLTSEPEQRAEAKIDDCISGFLRRLADGPRTETLSRLIKRFAGDGTKTIRLLKRAPFRSPTWQLVNNLTKDLRTQYWRIVPPHWENHDTDELNELIDRLIEVGRPKAAFHVVERQLEHIQSQRLIRLLREIARTNLELDNYRFSSHDISDAFDVLDKRSDVTRDELGQLEFITAVRLKLK